MIINPTLKRILQIVTYIVGSLFLYVVLLCCGGVFLPTTTLSIGQFVIPVVIIWFNIRNLSKPIQLSIIGAYLLAIAGIMLGRKIAGGYDWSFHCSVGFILVTPILTIFLQSAMVKKLERFSKIWIWTSILILDFVIAMPNIYFTDDMSDKLYVGSRKIEDDILPIYAIENPQYSYNFSVLLPKKIVYNSESHCFERHYMQKFYHRYHDNLLIQNNDTIYIKKRDATLDPSLQTIENNTRCLMRWQWQYYAWHKIKGLFYKVKNEQ